MSGKEYVEAMSKEHKVMVYNKSQVGETSVFEIKCKLETGFW
jgi:hypothetical protein